MSMSEKICENCKFWKQEKDKIYGLCNNENFVYQFENKEDPKKEDILIYWDSEMYGAGFKTGRKFGCKHFEIINSD